MWFSGVSKALANKGLHSETKKRFDSMRTGKCKISIYAEAYHIVVTVSHTKHGTRTSRRKVTTWTQNEDIEIPYAVDDSKRFHDWDKYEKKIVNIDTFCTFMMTDELIAIKEKRP
jgi:hypothetical protein